jgi:hypothetical protein
LGILGVITSWSPRMLRGNLSLLDSTVPSVTVKLNLILIDVMLSCLNVGVVCELASTFKVLTWLIMPVCRSCYDCLLVEDFDFAS